MGGRGPRRRVPGQSGHVAPVDCAVSRRLRWCQITYFFPHLITAKSGLLQFPLRAAFSRLFSGGSAILLLGLVVRFLSCSSPSSLRQKFHIYRKDEILVQLYTDPLAPAILTVSRIFSSVL